MTDRISFDPMQKNNSVSEQFPSGAKNCAAHYQKNYGTSTLEAALPKSNENSTEFQTYFCGILSGTASFFLAIGLGIVVLFNWIFSRGDSKNHQ